MEMWFSEFHTPDVKHSIRVNRQLYSRQSDYQRIDIFETPEFGRVLTLDGNVMLTERDEFIYDEMITHVPMAIHKEAKDILVIGAGDGGVVRELTRYDRVRHIDLVEMDPMVVEACRAYLPENACRLDDRRVHLHYENALRFIRRCEAKYDLIIVDSSDPFGPSEGLFTREFYGNCYNALKEDGIMVNQQGSPFYSEDAHAMQRSHKRIASTFQISRVYQAHIPTFAAGYWLFGFAGVCLLELLNPFVKLAFGKKYLFPKEIVLILCINFFINGMRRAVLIFKESMGLFWNDRYKAIAEAVLNLVISILLVTYFGVAGVFAGTFCSTVLTSVWVEPYVIYKYRLKKPVTGFFVKYAGYLGVMAAVWGITEYFCRFISGQAFMILVCRLGICLIVPNILLWFAYRRTAEWKVLWNLLKKIVEKVFTGDKR